MQVSTQRKPAPIRPCTTRPSLMPVKRLAHDLQDHLAQFGFGERKGQRLAPGVALGAAAGGKQGRKRLSVGSVGNVLKS